MNLNFWGKASKPVFPAQCMRTAGFSDEDSRAGKYYQQCCRLWKEGQKVLPNPVNTVNLNPAVGAVSPLTSSQSITSSRWSTCSG
jgi:hypothetical protein